MKVYTLFGKLLAEINCAKLCRRRLAHDAREHWARNHQYAFNNTQY